MSPIAAVVRRDGQDDLVEHISGALYLQITQAEIAPARTGRAAFQTEGPRRVAFRCVLEGVVR